MMKIPKKLQNFLSDSIWSIAGLVLMNMVSQFVVYPFWNRRMGNEAYGDVLYLISLMNILSISAGCACNNSRMVKSAAGATSNGDYGISLAVLSAAAIPFGIAVYMLNAEQYDSLDVVLYVLLVIVTMWRFYSDVQYRLNMDYRGYFRYYLFISLGYILGVGLFLLTNRWALALIPGEFLGLCTTYFYRSTIRSGLFRCSSQWPSEFKSILTLMGSSMIARIVFNGDRLLLDFLMGGSAVTMYYLASLLGKTMSLISTPLNSVIIGYLSRYKGKLTVKLMHLVTLLSSGAIVLVTIACIIASHILIFILYPQNYEAVKEYFIIANLTQVIYFTGNIITLLLLRFTTPKHQVTVNSVYAAAFVCLCIPATYLLGFNGFCFALLATSIARFAAAILLGYLHAAKGDNK